MLTPASSSRPITRHLKVPGAAVAASHAVPARSRARMVLFQVSAATLQLAALLLAVVVLVACVAH